jgi:hypothetical protein
VLDSPPSDDPEDGISDEVDEILAQRRNDLKISSWDRLWQVLFPFDATIPSPGMRSQLFIPIILLLTLADFVPPKVVEIS